MNRFFTLLFAASCLTAVGQSEYCLEGTVWDDELGGCVSVILNSADINNDGCVQLGDLLDLLTAYGDCGDEESAWHCGDPVSYQGYCYATVLIGEQCWFAENLRSENYENGDAIPSNLSDSEWSTTTSGATTVYGESAFSLETYGRLYNWYAVDDARGLCPSGWHVPTDGEWTVMTDFLGGESVAGGQMKTDYGWNDGGNGTNASGFSGLPGGYRDPLGFFYNAGFSGLWWSSSPIGSYAWYRALYYSLEMSPGNYTTPRAGFSVRCVRDAE